MKIKWVLRVFALVIGVVVLLALGVLLAHLKPFGSQELDSAEFWICLVVTIGVLVLGMCFEWGEKPLRIAGLVFQLLAIAVAVYTLNGVRTDLDLPGVLPSLGDSAARLFKSNSGALSGEGAQLARFAGHPPMMTGTLTVHYTNLSTADRFNVIEDQLAKIAAMAGRDNLILTKAIQDTQDDVAARDQAHVAAMKDLKKLIVELLAGGLPLAIFGIVWLIIGAFLSSLPNEVETWITRFHSWLGREQA